MNVSIQMGHVNDLKNLKLKDAAIAVALSYVRYWKDGIEDGVTPTPESLRMVEAKLSSAMEAGR